MKNKLTPRYFIITLVLAWAIYTLWPSLQYQLLSETQKEEMREDGTLMALEDQVIKQGLDLKGGMYIVLEVDLPTLIKNLAVNKDEKLDKVVEEVSATMSNPEADFFDNFKTSVSKNNLRLPRYFHEYGANVDDIVSGLEEEAADAVARVLEILQNRVDQFGVAEPNIQKQGKHRIIVELAGIQDPERARALLQSTALLEFFLVKSPELTNDLLIKIDNVLKGSDDVQDIISETKPADLPEEAAPADDQTMSVSELFGETEGSAEDLSGDVTIDQNIFEDRPFSSLLRNLGGDIAVPVTNKYAVSKVLDMPEVKTLLKSGNSQFLFGNDPVTTTNASGAEEDLFLLYNLEGAAELTGGVVEEAKATLGGSGSGAYGQFVVILDMNSEGSRQWARITGANIGKRVAIVLDKKVHMAPNIREKISQGGTQIEGFATMDEAKDIAIVLRAGALPAPVNIIDERVVGASLGSDSVKQGTTSVLIGLVLVLLFIIMYYKWSGTIANFALIWNLLLVLAVLASLGATLTLPGIAALILTVGMSIDANVIIFERIREEERKGKTPKAAIDAGYDRALTTIIDANVTTVIAALVLYQFGTGPIRGFATVLFWGIVISMFTAIFVTRTIFNTFTERKKLQRLSI